MNNKKILIGVSGSIAAYKIATLVRLLIKQGAEVRVVMTPSATQFITPLTLATLSKNPVHAAVASDASWNNHVELGLWADAFVVAPASANTLAKMANGLCDNMLLATYLASRCPVFIAPAMDLDMWEHPATQHNIQRLANFKNHHLIPIGEGELASGLVGKGRMAEPEEILHFLAQFFQNNERLPLRNRHILITSGATIEPIDPVRFISNHSTGKMGAAIADVCASLGAKVTVVQGAAAIRPTHSTIKTIIIQSAQDMYEAANEQFVKCDIAILAAAVADYTPVEVADKKIKKKTPTFNIELKKTTDIAAELGKQKRENQYLVGFALETNDALEHARKKLTNKNLDFIVLNTLEDKGAGFGHDTNKITLLDKAGEMRQFELKSKQEAARDIVQKLIEIIK